MRRRFNVALLPTAPPPKSKRLGSNINGSPFNRWFVRTLTAHGITNKAFAIVSKQPYSTVMTWRKRCDPQVWGQCRIAEALEALGVGDYEDLRITIRRLCDDSKGF